MPIHPTVYTVPYGLTYQLTSSVSASAFLPPILDRLSVASSAAYALRKLRAQYNGAAIRVRRSVDNAEKDIPFATIPQTRTNLVLVPANNNTGSSVAGVTMTIIGTGTEFNLPYVETRWQGTATAAGSLIYNHSFGGSFDPALHAPVTSGLTYSSSVGYRLVAGTAPPGQIFVRGSWRNSAGTFLGAALLTAPVPTATMQRGAAIGAAPIGVTYCQPGMVFNVALNEVVDFTARFYAPNVELGIGNARPMLTRDVPEVIAAPNDLDAEDLLLHCNGINQLTWSEQFDNAAWPVTGATVTANTTLAPNGALTADTITENAAAGQHRFARTTPSLTAGQEWTESIYVKRGVGSRQLQLGLSGTGLVAKAYFDLGTGTVGFTDQCTATITPAADGYYRISLTATIATTGAHTLFLAMANGTTNGSETYTGDGVSSLIVWGNQFNPGAILPYVIAEGTALTGVGSGFVYAQYDQSGNARDHVQATAGNQLSAVVGGAVVTRNGKAGLRVQTTSFMENNFGTINQPNTRSYVITREENVAGFGSGGHLIGNFGSTPNTTEYLVNATTMNQYATGTPNAQTVQSFVLNETAIFTSIYNSAVGSSLSKNGTNLTAPAGAGGGTGAINGSRVGAISGAPATTGPFIFSELIIFPVALSTSDRQALERDQGRYFSIPVA